MQLRMNLCLTALPLLVLCAYASSLTFQPGSGTPPITAPSDLTLGDYVASVRADLSAGKVTVINDIMKLTPAEAAAFWPIYSEYEQDLFALGDRRLDLMKRFVTAQKGQTLDNPAADALASDWLQLQRDSVDLMQTYYSRISKEVSSLHAAQFLQIEHRTNTVIDLIIASEMPLVMPVPLRPQGAAR